MASPRLSATTRLIAGSASADIARSKAVTIGELVMQTRVGANRGGVVGRGFLRHDMLTGLSDFARLG